jgi:hypothetical protein
MSAAFGVSDNDQQIAQASTNRSNGRHAASPMQRAGGESGLRQLRTLWAAVVVCMMVGCEQSDWTSKGSPIVTDNSNTPGYARTNDGRPTISASGNSRDEAKRNLEILIWAREQMEKSK